MYIDSHLQRVRIKIKVLSQPWNANSFLGIVLRYLSCIRIYE